MALFKLFYLIILLIIPVGELGRLSIGENIGLFLTDLILTLFVFIWFLYAFGIRKKVFVPPFSGRIILFILIGVFSLLLGSLRLETNEAIISGLFMVRWIEYASLYFIGAELFNLDPKFARTTLKTYLFVTFIVAVLGFFQIVLIPDFAQMAAEGGWDPHQYRLLSTFFDPNFVGGFLVVGLNFVLASLLFKPKSKEKLALGLFAVTLITAVVLTFSRSSYLALFLSIFIFASLKSRKLFLGISVLLLTGFLLLPPVQARLIQTIGLDDSAKARIVSWQNAFQISKDNPIIGVGFNAYRFTQDRYGFFTGDPTGGHSGSGADSSLLLILATTGVVGLSSYLFILWGLFKESLRKRKTIYGLAFLVSLGALLIHSQFVNSLLYPPIMAVFWVSAALMVTAKKE